MLHDQKFRQTSPEADKLCALCRHQGSEIRSVVSENIETFAAPNNPNTHGQLKNDAENSKKIHNL